MRVTSGTEDAFWMNSAHRELAKEGFPGGKVGSADDVRLFDGITSDFHCHRAIEVK